GPELWNLKDHEALTPESRLRLAALLAIADPRSARWRDFAQPLMNALLNLGTLDLDAWTRLMRPAAPALVPHLRDRFFDATATASDRTNAAHALARYADAKLYTELLLAADASQFSVLISAAPLHGATVVEAARLAIRSPRTRASAERDEIPLLRARNAAIAL